jgi:hypothetical protein
MSYTTVKDGIVALIGKAALIESQEAFDFENASAREYGNTFILVAEKGENDEDTSETLSDRIFDIQEWSLMIAFKKGAKTDITSRDEALRKKDTLIDILDKPSNNTFTRLLKYQSWEIEELDNYYLLTMKLKVIDTITYT